MHVRRGYLFWGSFLVLVGGIPLVVRWSGIDIGGFDRSWSWWPLILILLGLAIVFARTRLNIAAVVLAGVLLGGLVGTALASGAGDLFGGIGCAGQRTDLETLSQSGAFTPGASVELRHSCGELTVRPTSAPAWTLTANYHGTPPEISSTPSSLDVESHDGPFQRQDWAIFLPATSTHSVDAQVNAGSGNVDVSGMTLGYLDVQGNAADLTLVAEGGSVGTLDFQLNAGRGRITLDAPVSGGDLQVNAGAIDLCVPANAGLTLTVKEQFTFSANLGNNGLVRNGSTWTRPATGGPAITLSVEGNAASFTLNPEGGCQ
jgi:hypothetical protein